jgi:hypothetical protein
MGTESIEERIRARAYELWERDGSPEGRADDYWNKAQALVESESPATAMKSAAGKPLDE